MAEIYRHLRRRCWSVREGGRVVAHMPAITLSDVVFRASEAGRLRCLRRGQREVVARARGVPVDGLPRPAEAVRVRYWLVEASFRLADWRVVEAAAAWFELDGSAWAAGGVVGFAPGADDLIRRT